ncbi:membrane protein [Clostridia bacterium]|nr:membrane protein [Clostridia bacterium]
MDLSDVILLLIFLFLMYIGTFFSAAETALTTANKIRLKHMAENGNKSAITYLKVIENPSSMLSTILIGNNLANILCSSISTIIALNLWGNAGVGIATALLTIAILVFSEITPKNYATIKAEKLALRSARPIYFLMILFTPITYIVNYLATGILHLLGVDPHAKAELITEIELRSILDVSTEEGVIENDERKMINNVVDFGDSLAKDVMVPRVDVCFVDVNVSYQELIQVFRESYFTRIPVYENTTDNIIGIINMKDLLLYDQDIPFQIQNFLRKPYFTYEFKKTSELLREMRLSSFNIAIVLDEYGITAGLITLEDLLEEIVGEIRDEFDADEENSVYKISDYEYIAEASMKLDDINEKLDLSLESDVYDSLGGLIISELDHLPTKGEFIVQNDLTLIVETVANNRIEKVRIQIANPYALNQMSSS